MKETTFFWLMAILIVCATIAFNFELNHFWPITPTNTLAQEHCINENGIPFNDSDGNLIDCKIYKKITPSIGVTPTAGASATPTYIPVRTSSANASNSGENQ